MFRSIVPLPQFDREMRKLSRRFSTLEEDLDVLIRTALVAYHKLGIDYGGIVRIPGLGFEQPRVYKVRKFACRSLKGKGVRSGIRVIYAYAEEEDRIELIEIYYKGDKENEDMQRIRKRYAE